MDRPRTSTSAPREDLELVARLRAGDEAAFEELFESRFQGLFRFALARVGRDVELAKEIAQATFCKAFEKLDTYRGEAPLFTWLCAICRFELSAHYRRLRRQPPELTPSEGEPETVRMAEIAAPAGGDPETLALQSEVARQVHGTLEGLPPHYGQVLEWKYGLGLSVRDIAARLGSTTKAAESLLTRARLAFRSDFLLAGGVMPARALSTEESP